MRPPKRSFGQQVQHDCTIDKPLLNDASRVADAILLFVTPDVAQLTHQLNRVKVQVYNPGHPIHMQWENVPAQHKTQGGKSLECVPLLTSITAFCFVLIKLLFLARNSTQDI